MAELRDLYDINSNKVKLEIKQKVDYHQLKESLIITKKDAEELIKSGASSMLSVAEEAGFTSSSNFYKAFFKVTGKTPKDYL